LLNLRSPRRDRAPDPLLSGDDVMLARCEMDDAAFHRDRLREAETKLGERVEALKALEADRRLRAEHERVSAEHDRLAQEMQRIVEPIVKIAHLVRAIEFCDREIGRLNATSALRYGHVTPVLMGSAPVIATLFQDALLWDAFIAVAGLQSPPVASGGAVSKDKLRQAISQFASCDLPRSNEAQESAQELSLPDARGCWRGS
jgi:hypothetical protein